MLALLALAAPAQADLSEEWYLFRARADMQIKNYRAAIEAYRKALEKNSGNREALRGVGIAYELNGETDEAIAAYDRFLARYSDDPDVAFKQAHFLGWSRYRYRWKDAIRYYEMGLKLRDVPRERLALARLLGQQKETLPDALEQYRLVLSSSPDDAKVRAEYRKLLLWDPKHRDEAIREYQRLAAQHPEDRELALQLARLLAQDPERRDQAADKYEPLLERTPKDRALRLEYARLLAQNPSRRKEAIEQLKLSMGDAPDFETRLLYADLLSSDEGSRDEALTRYRALLREQPKNRELRSRYARMLAARKETSGAAIELYERMLSEDPDNAEAHAGLARAYAWEGDSDRALAHQQEAAERSSQPDDLRLLGKTLGAGREPRVGGDLSILYQTGASYGLFGVRTPARARTDLSPFVTTSVELGFEYYSDLASQDASGAFFSLEGEFRPSPSLKLHIGFGGQSIRRDADAINFLAELEYREDGISVRPRFERQPKYDSLLSLVGGPSGTATFDAVTSNLFSLRIERAPGLWRLWATPFLAAITGGSRGNVELGFEGAAERELFSGDGFGGLLGYDAYLSHYSHEEGPRYFSPALYFSQTPRFTVRYATPGSSLELSGGPSLQYQLTQAGDSGFILGGQVRAAGRWTLAPHLELGAAGALARTGSAYLRLDVSGSLFYVF
ncbi:MAG: hypothetical protein NVS2B9_03570 [Myxococcales bacterium]